MGVSGVRSLICSDRSSFRHHAPLHVSNATMYQQSLLVTSFLSMHPKTALTIQLTQISATQRSSRYLLERTHFPRRPCSDAFAQAYILDRSVTSFLLEQVMTITQSITSWSIKIVINFIILVCCMVFLCLHIFDPIGTSVSI